MPEQFLFYLELKNNFLNIFLAFLTPKKEKLTIIVDNKMNVLAQFPGSPKFSPNKGFKKGGIGVKNKGFYIVQQKTDSDIEEIEDPSNQQTEFDDVPEDEIEETTAQIKNLSDVLARDVAEIAGTSGIFPLKYFALK